MLGASTFQTVNGDGEVDIADARYLILHYTNPGGEL